MTVTFTVYSKKLGISYAGNKVAFAQFRDEKSNTFISY
jgi:hypothetical protein